MIRKQALYPDPERNMMYFIVSDDQNENTTSSPESGAVNPSNLCITCGNILDSEVKVDENYNSTTEEGQYSCNCQSSKTLEAMREKLRQADMGVKNLRKALHKLRVHAQKTIVALQTESQKMVQQLSTEAISFLQNQTTNADCVPEEEKGEKATFCRPSPYEALQREMVSLKSQLARSVKRVEQLAAKDTTSQETISRLEALVKVRDRSCSSLRKEIRILQTRIHDTLRQDQDKQKRASQAVNELELLKSVLKKTHSELDAVRLERDQLKDFLAVKESKLRLHTQPVHNRRSPRLDPVEKETKDVQKLEAQESISEHYQKRICELEAMLGDTQFNSSCTEARLKQEIHDLSATIRQLELRLKDRERNLVRSVDLGWDQNNCHVQPTGLKYKREAELLREKLQRTMEEKLEIQEMLAETRRDLGMLRRKSSGRCDLPVDGIRHLAIVSPNSSDKTRRDSQTEDVFSPTNCPDDRFSVTWPRTMPLFKLKQENSQTRLTSAASSRTGKRRESAP